MKTLIYQVKVGTPPAFYDTCIASVAEYCKRYNIDHIVQTEPLIRLRPVNSHRSKMAVERFGYLPHFEKANAFSQERLEKYNQVAYIDADIFIRKQSPNIFESVNTNVAVAGVRECDMPLIPQFASKVKDYSYSQYGMLPAMKAIETKKGIPFFNTGLLVVNSKLYRPYLNGESPADFVQRKEFEPFVNGEGKWKWASDQTPLNWWYIKEGMPTQHLDWKWNALYTAVPEHQIRDAYAIHFFLASKLEQQGIDIQKVIHKLT